MRHYFVGKTLYTVPTYLHKKPVKAKKTGAPLHLFCGKTYLRSESKRQA